MCTMISTFWGFRTCLEFKVPSRLCLERKNEFLTCSNLSQCRKSLSTFLCVSLFLPITAYNATKNQTFTWYWTESVRDLDQPLGDLLPSSLKLPCPERDLDRSTPPMHLTKCAKMALTHRILPEFRSSISCLGWYWGRTGQAMWLASKSPKSGMISASRLISSTTPK